MMDAVRLEVRRYTSEVILHRHAFHQVVLPYAGRLDIVTNGREGQVAGDIGSFVTAGHDHSFFGRDGSACIVLDVPQIWAANSMGTDAVPSFFAIGPDIRGLITYICSDQLDRLPAGLRAAWSSLLLARLDAQLLVPADRTEQAINRALAFLRDKLADPVGVPDIASAAGTSPSRLHDAFATRLGTTPHAYLVALRLDAAERMLADPRLSIAEVAIRSGYADQSALGRAMRRERNTTTATLRRLLCGKTGGNAPNPRGSA